MPAEHRHLAFQRNVYTLPAEDFERIEQALKRRRSRKTPVAVPHRIVNPVPLPG